MKRFTKIGAAVGAALSLGLAAAAVEAQPYGMGWSGAPGYYMHVYGMGYGMGPQAMFNAYPGTAEQRLADLKEELGITAKQESAWQAFVNTEKKQDENRQAWFARMREARAAASTPELLAQQTEILKQRQAELAAEATALKNLYATFTLEQRAIADQRAGGFGPAYGAGYGYAGFVGGRFR